MQMFTWQLSSAKENRRTSSDVLPSLWQPDTDSVKPLIYSNPPIICWQTAAQSFTSLLISPKFQNNGNDSLCHHQLESRQNPTSALTNFILEIPPHLKGQCYSFLQQVTSVGRLIQLLEEPVLICSKRSRWSNETKDFTLWWFRQGQSQVQTQLCSFVLFLLNHIPSF